MQDMGRFKFWTGDRNFLDYGGTWVWQIPGTHRFHFIELTNWEDAVGAREKAGSGLPTYHIQLSEVDLSEVSAQQITNAKESCGADNEPQNDARTAGWLNDYGAKADLFDEDGDNWRALFRAAAEESRIVADNSSVLDSRVVNRLGSTAREAMKGDMASALGRKLDEGDPAARVIAKMYQAADYNTLGAGKAEDIRAVVDGLSDDAKLLLGLRDATKEEKK